ncbi:hypothetical protein B0H19DRAFT_1058617 [Mycena capillaripes]|nr:hypothetical protein B0H19DRAFT_1058617 [Mycena capillaripes]
MLLAIDLVNRIAHSNAKALKWRELDRNPQIPLVCGGVLPGRLPLFPFIPQGFMMSMEPTSMSSKRRINYYFKPSNPVSEIAVGSSNDTAKAEKIELSGSTEVQTVVKIHKVYWQGLEVVIQESSIVHFACQGIQESKNPLGSGLMLSDGHLKLSQIMQKRDDDNMEAKTKAMSLAFISACETAKGNSSPDEAMHVVATMWQVNKFSD